MASYSLCSNYIVIFNNCLQILRKQTDSHLQTNTRVHLDLVCAKLQVTQEEQDKLRNMTSKLQDKVDMLQRQLVEVNLKYNNLRKKIESDQKKADEKVNQALKQLGEKVSTSQQRVEENINVLRERQNAINKEVAGEVSAFFKQQEEKVDAFQKALMDKINMLEARFRSKAEREDEGGSPQFMWKIEGFKQLFLEAKRGGNNKIASSPFYTATYGYKLKLSINPNGQGLGENTYLSVCLTVMKGEYDAVLPWPFHKKVIFTLIDQQENPDRQKHIVKYLFANPELKNFSRPVADENPGRGISRFIPHSELAMERFAKDGNLYIQVRIRPPS